VFPSLKKTVGKHSIEVNLPTELEVDPSISPAGIKPSYMWRQSNGTFQPSTLRTRLTFYAEVLLGKEIMSQKREYGKCILKGTT